MVKKQKNPKRDKVEVVALIPARGGKQSIPWKNLQKLGGKTLLAWAIDVAFEAKEIDVVVVSTENPRIAKEAESLGAIVAPRPRKYSRPSSGDAGWYQHAVQWMEKVHGWQPELLVNLRPTSPLRFAADIDKMVMHLKENRKIDGMKSVIPAPLHPYKMWQMEARSKKRNANSIAGRLVPVFDNSYRRKHGPDQPRQKVQEMFPVYFQDGQIDITRRKFVLKKDALKNENIWGKNLHGFLLDPRTSTDLDEPADFIRAEKIYRDLQKERKNK